MSLYITRKINTPEKQAVWMLAGLLLCAFFLYVYFVQITIHAIVERSDILKDIKSLNLKLGELESEYNILRKTLTYDYARSLGFNDAEKKVFAKRARLAQGSAIGF